MAHDTFKVGDLTAVIGDNAAEGEQRQGYNGVWSLTHAAGTRSVFVPGIAGLNLEHVFDGEHDEPPDVFFEPRRAPMTFTRLSDTEAELHQPPTQTFHVESWTRFTLSAPHYLDMSFRCVPTQHVFRRGYMGVFWASYIDGPADKSMYFLGVPDGAPAGTPPPTWMQLCTPRHNDGSTIRHVDDKLELTFREGHREALYRSLSPLRFVEPLFYGHVDDLVWIVMFDRTAGLRLTHSPSGGGSNAARRTTNPAWDFQLIVPEPEVMTEHTLRARTVLRPRCGREEILNEYAAWTGSR